MSSLGQIKSTAASTTTTAAVTDEPFTTVLVSAIPKSFRSADLRNFFSVVVETQAFRCFHFRHRPMPPSSAEVTSQSQMCFVQIYNRRLKEFIRLYHRKHWINLSGNYLSSICLISEVTNENNGNERRVWEDSLWTLSFRWFDYQYSDWIQSAEVHLSARQCWHTDIVLSQWNQCLSFTFHYHQ